MMILIMGENKSGKSAFAEQLAVKFGRQRYYIATMQPHGVEGAARVQKHQKQRAGLGFVTLELPHRVGDAVIPQTATVLLEDVSNLLANAMFEQSAGTSDVLEDIMALAQRVACLIVVTISGFDSGSYDEETRRYMAALVSLNRQLADAAETVVEMRAGKPVYLKGAFRERV